MHFTSYATLALAAAPAVSAWGTLGHMTVGFIAQNFLQDETVSWAQGILGITNDSYLASVAPWADTYRYTSEGSWSAPLHFIDAEDKPPSSCSVDFDRDCGDEGCSISAIANYVRPQFLRELPICAQILTHPTDRARPRWPPLRCQHQASPRVPCPLLRRYYPTPT